MCYCEGEFLVHGRLAALLLLLLLLQLLLQLLSSADDAGIAVFVRAEHSVFFLLFVLRWVCLVRRSWSCSTPLVSCGAKLWSSRRNLQSVGSQNNQNQRRLLLKEDWPFNNQGPGGPGGPEWSAAPVRGTVRTEE
jgi:hypothetical protein